MQGKLICLELLVVERSFQSLTLSFENAGVCWKDGWSNELTDNAPIVIRELYMALKMHLEKIIIAYSDLFGLSPSSASTSGLVRNSLNSIRPHCFPWGLAESYNSFQNFHRSNLCHSSDLSSGPSDPKSDHDTQLNPGVLRRGQQRSCSVQCLGSLYVPLDLCWPLCRAFLG